jgi:integrase
MALTGKLSAVKVDAIRRAKKPGYAGDGGGLYLQVSRYGTASWVFRYRLGTELDKNGRPKLKEMGLGPAHTIGLAEARDAALNARKRLLAFRHGEDGAEHPLAARKAAQAAKRIEAAKAITFRDAAEQYIVAHREGLRSPKSEQQWRGSLRDYAYPIIGNLPVASIDLPLVLKVLEPIWKEKTETASRVRGRIEATLGWATTRGYRQGDNPARWGKHLENLLPKRSKVKPLQHYAALPFNQIGAFTVELRAHESIPARALEFAILTAARPGEVIGARWSEIDEAERLWTIPANRMKAHKEHRVPLSEAALSVLKKMAEIRSGDFVFPGQKGGKRPIASTAFFYLVRDMGRSNLTAHGFRSTFRDWTAERTNFAPEVAEMALAHTVADSVERAYRRGDLFQKRRQLADAWAKFCAAPATAEGAKVVSIRKAAE